MARSNLQLQIAHSPVLRYGLAVLSVSVALGWSLLLERFHFRNVEVPLFLFAIAITVWYAGIGPAILAVVLSGLADPTSSSSRFTALYITRVISRTLSSSYYLRRFLPGSAPSGGASSEILFKPATTSRSKWQNERSRPACSISRMTRFSSVI